jgi:hypothetical protein
MNGEILDYREKRRRESNQLLKALRIANRGVSDADALEIPLIFELWKPGKKCVAGEILNYKGLLYRVIQDHTSQANWLPGTATLTLYNRIQVDEPGKVLPWVIDEAVNIGDEREYQGIVYVCVLAHTTQTGWVPPTAPTLWRVV